MLKNIEIIQVGRDKFDYIKYAKKDFFNRLNHFFSISEIILKESKLKSVKERLLDEEKDIRKYIGNNSKIIILSSEGTTMNSQEFSKFIYKFSSVIFIIGGSDGLSENIKNCSNHIISLSKMTFPHHIAKILLVEQLYRAATIKNHLKYHK
jgi:23S rRNA (pseudouridine1915-N3)-methyltransferase